MHGLCTVRVPPFSFFTTKTSITFLIQCYFHVPKAKREPKYAIIDIVEAAKAMGIWIGIEPYLASIIGGLNQWLCRQPSHVRTPTCYT